MTAPALLIRPSTPADLPAITAIYAQAVLHGTGTFELDPPDQAEMSRRRDDVLSKGLPWLVAQERGDPAALVLGYAYANHFRPRKAYRFCLEDSIYLHPDARGRGVGKLLLTRLLDVARNSGFHTVIARIEATSTGSLALHESLGFTKVGVEREVGRKLGRWLDSAIMQKMLAD